MKKIIYFIFALTLIVGASCSKEAGPEGPAGTRGERGEKGETGANGIAGTDGNLLLYGNAAPVSTLGKVGDFYIDKKDGNLYGPKATSGWGTAVDMRGATGATGAKGATGNTGATGSKGDKGATGDRGATGATGVAGSQFLSGTVAPAAAVGKPGDFYFNTVTGQLFGPKNLSNTWAGGISLKGAKGEKGDPGTANVIYSDFASSRTGIRDTTIDGSKLQVTHIVEPKVTTGITESGTVLVYFKYNSDIFGLPYTSFAGSKVNTVDFFLKPGRIYITRFTHDNSASSRLSTLLQYRYIIIPGGLKAKLNGVNLGNYEDVKAALNVK